MASPLEGLVERFWAHLHRQPLESYFKLTLFNNVAMETRIGGADGLRSPEQLCSPPEFSSFQVQEGEASNWWAVAPPVVSEKKGMVFE